jgi:DNA-binding NarL/FixJ family response regulator
LTLPVGNALPVPLAVDSDAPAVVLYSSRTDNATVVAAALAGAGAPVRKPCSIETLLDAIRMVAAALPPIAGIG